MTFADKVIARFILTPLNDLTKLCERRILQESEL